MRWTKAEQPGWATRYLGSTESAGEMSFIQCLPSLPSQGLVADQVRVVSEQGRAAVPPVERMVDSFSGNHKRNHHRLYFPVTFGKLQARVQGVESHEGNSKVLPALLLSGDW